MSPTGQPEPGIAEPVQPTPIDWREFEGKSPPPRSWWIQDWLGASPTLCSGTGGIGKSLLWQTIATSLATGREFLGATAAPLKVLAWMCEDDPDEIWRRQAAICSHFEIPIGDLAGKLTVVPRLGFDNTLLDLLYGRPTPTALFSRLREQVNDLGTDLLVLDNIGQVFGGNEADRHHVTVFVNLLQGLVTGRPFGPVLLGHVARTAGSEFAGSAAWENACRMRWYMGHTLPDQPLDADETPDSDVVYLAKRKANYSAKDYRRLRFTDGLLLPEEVGGRRFDQGQQNDIAERVVMKGLAKLIETGVQPTDGRTSGDFLPAQLVAKGLAEGHSRKELTSAMNRCMTAGRLRRAEVGRYANRTPKYGLKAVLP